MDYLFGNWGRRRPKSLDLTQQELAQRVGCSVSLIFKIKANGHCPSRQIAELLGLPLLLTPLIVREHELLAIIEQLQNPACRLPHSLALALGGHIYIPAHVAFVTTHKSPKPAAEHSPRNIRNKFWNAYTDAFP
ncbi:MAG TPA: hypothetical protein VK897_18730 [Anaerolineales bacterium]|nr:hypothetical protein [Anaerolineales bacterium]